MGLFNWGRKSQQMDAAPAPTKPAPAPLAASPDFDALVAAARANQPGAIASLWNAVFGLQHWHFVVKGRPDLSSANVPLFGVVLDERPMLCAFTSEERATQFAVKRGFPEGFAVVSVAMPKAVATALAYERNGVVGVVFDENVGGGQFAIMPNLVGMYAVQAGLPLLAAAERIGVDPGKALHDRASATGAREHIEELVAWACQLRKWWMLADAHGPDPRVWSDAFENKVTLAVFSSEEAASHSARLMKNLSADGQPLIVAATPANAAATIERLIKEKGLQIVALDMRLSLPAEAVPSMVRVFAQPR